MGFIILQIVLCGFWLWLSITQAREFKTMDDYMNVCIDGINHKESPGEEKGLANEFCSPWASRSCCTPKIAKGIESDDKWLNFNWHHCKTLSPRCNEHFMMDLCFYECSPNLGPWVVEDVRKIRKERFRNVPMCQQTCTNWWEACKDDVTCLVNWSKFNWSEGINTCPQGTECKPFHQIFDGPNHFCENVFNNSFKVVDDNQDCFVNWFDHKLGNPNEEVARKRASELLNITYEVVKTTDQVVDDDQD